MCIVYHSNCRWSQHNESLWRTAHTISIPPYPHRIFLTNLGILSYLLLENFTTHFQMHRHINGILDLFHMWAIFTLSCRLAGHCVILCVCSLFSDDFSATHTIQSRMRWWGTWIIKWKGFGKKRSWSNFKVLSRHSPAGTEKLRYKWGKFIKIATDLGVWSQAYYFNKVM
jgi:hypothetical protein